MFRINKSETEQTNKSTNNRSSNEHELDKRSSSVGSSSRAHSNIVEKLIVFTYKTDNHDDVKFHLKLENENSNNEYLFERFNQIMVFQSQEIFQEYGLYFVSFELDLSDHLNQSYKIVQSYKRNATAELHYETTKRKFNRNENEFLLDLEFLENENYYHYKKPVGDKIENKSHKLILFLLYVLKQTIRNPYELLENYITCMQLVSAKSTLFDSAESLNFFIDFFVEYLDHNRINETFFTIIMGIVDFKFYNDISEEILSSNLHRVFSIFIPYLDRENITKILINYKNSKKLYLNGVSFLFNFTQLSFEYLIPLSIAYVDANIEFISLEDIFTNLTNNGHLVITAKNLDSSSLRNTFKKLKCKLDKEFVISMLVDLCGEFHALIELILVLSSFSVENEVNLIEKVLLTNKQQIIARLLMSNYKALDSETFQKQLAKFLSIKKYMDIFKFQYLKYMIKISNSLQQINDLVKCLLTGDSLDNEKQYLEIWTEISKMYMDKKFKSNLDSLITFFDLLPKNLDDETVKSLVEQLKKKLKNLVQKLVFKEENMDHIKKILNDKCIFPFGSLNFLVENYSQNLDKDCNNKQIKFMICEIVAEQIDRCESNQIVENIVCLINKLNLNTNLEELINDVLLKIFDKLSKSFGENSICISIFENILKELIKKNSMNILADFLNYQEIFIDEKFEEIYLKIIKDNIINSNSSEGLRAVLKTLKSINFKSSLKDKLVITIYSLKNDLDENYNSVREYLFKNLSKDHLIYITICFSESYPELNTFKLVKKLKSWLKDAFGDLFNMNLTNSEIESLAKYDEQRIDFLQEMVNFSLEKNKNFNLKNEIHKVIIKYRSNMERVYEMLGLFEFLAEYSKDFEPLRLELVKITEHKDTNNFSSLNSFESYSKYQYISDFYKNFKSLKSFKTIFDDVFKAFEQAKRTELNQITFFTGIFESIEIKYMDIIAMINDGNLTNKSIQKYFSFLTGQEQIHREAELLNNIKPIENQSKIFFVKSVFNFSRLELYKGLFTSLFKVFYLFGLSTEDNEDEPIKLIERFITIKLQAEIPMTYLNTLIDDIQTHVGDFILREKNDETILIINEMAKSFNLLSFLMNKKEFELRNIIDKIDYHGNGTIQPQSIIELLKVQQFFFKIYKIAHDEKDKKEFLKQIIHLVETDENLKNIATLLFTSNNLTESFKIFFDTIHNREETIKMKIVEIAKNSEFFIEFSELTGTFNLKTEPRNDKVLNLNDLFDLRDRALLTLNSSEAKTADSINFVQSEDVKESYKIFIETTESLNRIVGLLNQLHLNGYAIKDYFANDKMLSLKVTNRDNSRIKNFEEQILSECESWKTSLHTLVKKYKVLTYFWGKDFFNIEKLLLERDFDKLKDYLYFVNSNIMTHSDEFFPIYPESARNLTSIERLELLAEYLEALIQSLPKQTQIKIDPALNFKPKEEMILVKANSYEYYINSLLTVYRDYENLFPISNQILFSNTETTWQELKSFLYRSISNNADEKRLYCLVGPERFSFENQSLLLDTLDRLLNAEKHYMRLAVITHDKNVYELISSNLKSKNIKVIELKNFGDILNHNNLISNLVSNWRKDVCVYTSAYSGLGKSTQIKHLARHLNTNLIRFTISETDSFLKLGQRLKECLRENEYNVSIHFDVLHSNEDEILNEFLFSVVYLNSIKSNEFNLVLKDIKFFFIEIANTFEESLKKKLYISKLFNKREINDFSIDYFIPPYKQNKEIRSEDDLSLNQIVCNYLKIFNESKCALIDFKPETAIDKHTKKSYLLFNQMVWLNDAECKGLLKKYFVSNKQLSYIVLDNFIKLLAFYFIRLSENDFLSLASLNFIIGNINDDRFKGLILGLRERIIKILIDLALENVTNSITNVRYNQKHAMELVGLKEAEREIKYMYDKLISFQDSNYLIIVFSNFDSYFEFIYSKISQLPQSIVSLFRAQSLGANQYQFIDYRSQNHENLLKRLEKLFGKINLDDNQSFLFDSNLFNDNQHLKSIVNNLNHSLSVINSKLNGYIITADNYLKMMLIYNKVSSNLPVVMIGETGCGKTSLISYLAMKILNIKLIILNIHAGITQENFIKIMKDYFAIARRLDREIWLFFDEFNTSESMYLVSEMISQRTLLSKPVPTNFKFLAACNPYKIKSKKVDVGLVIERESTKLVHVVLPLPERLIDNVWDYGSLNRIDEKNYIYSMIRVLRLNKYYLGMFTELLSDCQEFIRKIEDESSVSLRDVNRFRTLFEWFCKFNRIRPGLVLDSYHEFFITNMILSIMVCYYVRITKKELRAQFLDAVIKKLGNFNVKLTREKILSIYEKEQDEYLNRMNLPKGIAKNDALRENVFISVICIMNKIPLFICGKPGCSKTLSIQLILSYLKGIESVDQWFKKLPGIFAVTYQGSESSTSEGILLAFEKAKEVTATFNKCHTFSKVIPLIVFDEMGLAEISKKNPLKVLHSLLETDNNDVSFVGISNWRLDASKMNRGIFLSRPDLSLEDLEKTAKIIFKSFTINENLYSVQSYEYFFKLMANLARAYYLYKFSLSKTEYSDFHGTRDFYSLIKQISEKINEKRYESKAELIQIIKCGIQRNFQGLKLKSVDFKKIFIEIQNEPEFTNVFKEEINSLDLIKSNLQDPNARYLMLITKGDSASFILDNYLKNSITDVGTFIGSQFEDDLIKEENNFRILSDIILYMEKGWTITLQDMDSIYGSLYDMFNQNFTLIGGTKKNCRIALGSVTNPMCYVNDKFRCIIILKEEDIAKCEPPFLNRFEKHVLNFETITNNYFNDLIDNLKDWLNSVLFDQYSKIYKDQEKNSLALNNIITNYNPEETVTSLVFYYENKYKTDGLQNSNINKEKYIVEMSKISLMKVLSNFALLLISQSEKIDQKEFCDTYRALFKDSENLNMHLKTMFNRTQGKTTFKSVVYTFDNVHKPLRLYDIGKYDEVKVGNFKTEITLTQVLNTYFKSKNELLIIRFKWLEDFKHLKLVKYLIDKLESTNKSVNKSICILIHMNFYINNIKNQNETSMMSFLSGWDQITIDNLDDKYLNLTNLVTKTTNQVLTSEKIFTINEVMSDLLLNALNKIKYTDYYNADKTESNEFSELIQIHKKILLDNLCLVQTNKNKLNEYSESQLELVDIVKQRLLAQIEANSLKDWRLEVLTNENLLKYGYDIPLLVKSLLNDEIMVEFLKVFYSLEKYFPFESFFNFDRTKECYLVMKEIFFDIVQDHFEGISTDDLKVINANQSNKVDVIFGLRFPFILKEVEALDKVISKEMIANLVEEEKNVFMEDSETGVKFKELNESIRKSIEKNSIYSKYSRLINQEPYLCHLYLEDLLKLKLDHLIKRNQEFENLFYYLIHVINQNNRIPEISNIYLSVSKSVEFFEKLYDYLKLFKNLIKIDSLVDYLRRVTINSYMSIQNQLFSHIFNYSTQFLSSLSEPQDLSYSINDFASLFDNLFIESISIESLREKYYFFYFVTQFFKLFSSFYMNDEIKFKRLLIRLLKIITNKLTDDQFLKDVETVKEIVSFIKQEVQIPQDQNCEKVKTKFEFFVYSLSIELSPDNEDVMNLIFDQKSLNKNSIEYVYSILQKFFYNINIDLSLSFLVDSDEYTLLIKLNEYIKRVGLECDISVIFIEILRNNLLENNDLKPENFSDKLVQELFDILNNFENGVETELTRNIKLKHIACLTSIAYLKELLYFYYQDILKGNEASYKTLNRYLGSNQLKCLNSLRILILRGLNENVPSYTELKDLVLCNHYLEWRKYLNFGDIKKKFEVYIASDSVFKKIIGFGKNLDVKKLSDENTRKFLHSFLSPSNNSTTEKDCLSFYLGLFNNFYVLNSNSEFYTSKSKHQFIQYVMRILNGFNMNKSKTLNQVFIANVLKNFQNNNFLKIDPNAHIEDLKVISLVYHSFSIILSYSKNNNPLTAPFFKNGDKLTELSNNYWVCSRDDEEFTMLQKLGGLTNFVTETQLNTLRFNPKKDYALYKCSNECNYYYIVGDCTLTGENTDNHRCPKGHLLMGPKQHALYERDGHKRIPNPAEFIKKRLRELCPVAPFGYAKSAGDSTEFDYSVRDLKPLTYRILNFILHSTLYMLKQLDFYSEIELKNLLAIKEPESLNTYLLKKIINDYRMIGRLLDTNQSYLFVHSVLAKLPDLLESNMFKNLPGKIEFDIRNQFEIIFQDKIVNQFDCSVQQTITLYKTLYMIKDEVDEIKLLVNDINETNAIAPSLRENYPLLKLMKVNKVKNDLINFEKTFYNSNQNKENYPLIDLYLKNKENLQIIEILPIYIEILNYLLNKYDYNITRKEAREKILIDCFDTDNMIEKFEELKAFWNKYLKIELSDDCKVFQPVELRDDSPLSLLLCDNKLEIGSGIHAKLVLKYLASYQNTFLEQFLQINPIKLPYLKSFNRELLTVNLAQPKYMINIKDFQADFFVRFYSLLIPDTMKLEYDLEKFQLFLIKSLINGKRLLDINDKSIRNIQYSGELLSENVLLISNLRENLKQEKIEENKINEIKKFVEQLKENKDNNGFSILKNIFKSLEIFICFLNTANKNTLNSEMKFKEYFKNINLKNISDFVKNLEPICSLSIKNIIEIYEMFEIEMFSLSTSQFEDKYRKNLTNECEKDFEKFLDLCDGELLPKKEDIRDALMKFSMRCLFADINEKDSLTVYLTNRLDLWPTGIPAEKLDKLGETFPNSIQVTHTAGNLIDVINRSINGYVEVKKVENVVQERSLPAVEPSNEKIGRPNLVSSKEKQDNRTKKIFII